MVQVTDTTVPRRPDPAVDGVSALDAALAFESVLGRLYQGDCLQLFPEIDADSVDLLFADPPFNLGKDYGLGVKDSLGETDYLTWTSHWITHAARVLKPGGSMFVFHLPKWNVEIGHLLNDLAMVFRHWIAVDIKLSLPIQGRLYPAHYSLLYYTKGKPRRFQNLRVPIPICRHCGGDIKDYGGHRGKLHPQGLNLSDVWLDIPPVRHRSTKRRAANELSEKLLRRVLEIASAPGDVVLDPFGGSGTTFAVAEQLHRHWIGFELGDCEPIVGRLRGEQPRVPPKNLGDARKGMKRPRSSTGARLVNLFD